MHPARSPACARRLAAAGVAAGAAAIVALSLAPPSVHAAGGLAGTAAAAGAPTYRDVAPIFRAKCASCHVLGGIAAFPLTSARDAALHAEQILIVTRSGQMPPWPPGKDSPAFVGQSKRVLTVQEKNTIARWVRGGAQR